VKEFVQPRFSAKVNGTPCRLTGETLPFENSLRTHVRDRPGCARRAAVRRVFAHRAAGEGRRRKLDARLSVRFTQARQATLVRRLGKIGLREVGLSLPDAGGVAEIRRWTSTSLLSIRSEAWAPSTRCA
jgi:hypothetical protein